MVKQAHTAKIAALEARISRLQTKVARSAGAEVVWSLLDQRAFMKVWKDLGKQDEQAADLLYQVLTTLQDKFDVKDNDYNALNRIRQLVKAGSGWKPALQRNNIFKAANLLGIKLPSMMFASDRTAESKVARKGITVDWRGSFSVKDIPQDSYGQVYDAAILIDKRKSIQKALTYVWKAHERKIMQMKDVWEATSFLNKEIEGLTGRAPKWHHYSMPD